MQFTCRPLYHSNNGENLAMKSQISASRSACTNRSSSSSHRRRLFRAVDIQLTPASLTMSSRHRFFGLPVFRFPVLGCHSQISFAHRSSFILAIFAAHRHFRVARCVNGRTNGRTHGSKSKRPSVNGAHRKSEPHVSKSAIRTFGVRGAQRGAEPSRVPRHQWRLQR